MVWDYLEQNNRFYATFWSEHPLYSTRHPNADEAERAAMVMRFMARLCEASGTVNPRILDVGCGRGWLTALLGAWGHCEGCEPTPESIGLARRLFPGITFHACTLGELERQPSFVPFDVLVCSDVIEHVPRTLKGAFVEELVSGLAAEGTCIVTTPRGEMWRQCGDSSNQMIEEWLTECELEQLFTGRGFAVVERDRASATRRSFLDRLVARARRALGSAAPALHGLQAALDYRSALYQGWRFRKLTS